jgi:hypothetical protein
LNWIRRTIELRNSKEITPPRVPLHNRMSTLFTNFTIFKDVFETVTIPLFITYKRMIHQNKLIARPNQLPNRKQTTQYKGYLYYSKIQYLIYIILYLYRNMPRHSKCVNTYKLLYTDGCYCILFFYFFMNCEYGIAKLGF